jgi:hypothetical protein
MVEKTQLKNGSTAVEQLREEYKQQSTLFDAQPAIVQRFLEVQASQIANAYIERQHNLRFSLPDRVILSNSSEPLKVPQPLREQRVGKIGDFISRRDVHETLRQRFAVLDQSSDKAVAASAELVRYAAANHMVHNMLPAGRSISYVAAEDGDIPSIPVGDSLDPESAMTAETDAIAEEEIGRAHV